MGRWRVGSWTARAWRRAATPGELLSDLSERGSEPFPLRAMVVARSGRRTNGDPAATASRKGDACPGAANGPPESCQNAAEIEAEHQASLPVGGRDPQAADRQGQREGEINLRAPEFGDEGSLHGVVLNRLPLAYGVTRVWLMI